MIFSDTTIGLFHDPTTPYLTDSDGRAQITLDEELFDTLLLGVSAPEYYNTIAIIEDVKHSSGETTVYLERV